MINRAAPVVPALVFGIAVALIGATAILYPESWVLPLPLAAALGPFVGIRMGMFRSLSCSSGLPFSVIAGTPDQKPLYRPVVPRFSDDLDVGWMRGWAVVIRLTTRCSGLAIKSGRCGKSKVASR
jgi:hypothetical protein